MYPNIAIGDNGPISKAFLSQNITSFEIACSYVRNLDFKRNSDKTDPLIVLKEECGTCSTKHALLKSLAIENNIEGIVLTLGLFKMNSKNTPESASILSQYKLDHIPEAHCYLKFENEVLDFTKATPLLIDYNTDLIEELTIEPYQVNEFKITYQRNHLLVWISKENIPYSLEQIWNIREECIKALY